MGVQFVDVDWDGKKDLVYHRYLGPGNIQKGAYKNTGNGWVKLNDQYAPPYNMHNDLAPYGQKNFSVVFVDVDGDGHEDMLYHRYNGGVITKGAYRNNGYGWTNLGDEFAPPYHLYADGYGDMGAKFVDVDHDGKKDLIYHRYNGGIITKGAYKNTGSGWQAMGNQFYPPYHFFADGLGEMGVSFADVDGDGFEDLIYYRHGTTQIGVYRNTGNGWSKMSDNYNVPYHLFVDFFQQGMRNMGVKFVDVDNDGKKDLLYHRYNGGVITKGAYKNTGAGWQLLSSNFFPPYHFYADGYGDMGVKFVDIDGDGDGDEDMLFYRWNVQNQCQAYFNHFDAQ